MSEMIKKLHAQQGIRNFVEKHIDPHHTMSDFKLNKEILLPFLKQHKLDTLICDLKQPVLGVCLGLQLMCSHSEEGDTTCLGIFPEKVKKFVPQAGDLSHYKIPHMGWNSLSELKNPLFEGLSEADYFYFVHSYYATTGADTAATCTYLNPFSAALQRDNFYATQFHPEKSGSAGSKLLSNFINLKF